MNYQCQTPSLHVGLETVHITMFSCYRALQDADVILLLGARLNWILHFGAPPRFKPNVKFIQV